MRRFFRRLGALSFGMILALLLLEAFLRIHNPFPFRVRAQEILLPANREYRIENARLTGLDSLIIHRKNSLGFRGDSLPVDYEDHLSLFTVGGSTTECLYISDQKDWPARLAQNLRKRCMPVWLNNAGLDGHSTLGHYVMLRDYLLPLKPKIILFLVGINDLGREDLLSEDPRNWDLHAKHWHYDHEPTWQLWLITHSELVATVVNLMRVGQAHALGLSFREVYNPDQVDSLSLSSTFIQAESRRHQAAWVPAYQQRVTRLIQLCRDQGVRPVFLTQPLGVGAGVDSLTGINLGLVKTGSQQNGLLDWKLLELYNQALKEVCDAEEVFCIDLAHLLPKSSAYFYDKMHFSNLGCQQVGDLVYQALHPYLREHYPTFCTDP